MIESPAPTYFYQKDTIGTNGLLWRNDVLKFLIYGIHEMMCQMLRNGMLSRNILGFSKKSWSVCWRIHPTIGDVSNKTDWYFRIQPTWLAWGTNGGTCWDTENKYPHFIFLCGKPFFLYTHVCFDISAYYKMGFMDNIYKNNIYI